jgi:hypothetical protein
MAGEIIISSSKELLRQGQRERTLAILHQMIEDAHRGKRQFLSGILFFMTFCGRRIYAFLLLSYWEDFQCDSDNHFHIKS